MIGQSVPFNEAALTGRRDWLDSGAGHARFEIYGNTRPATDGGAAGASPLVEIPLARPCGTVASGFLSLVPLNPFELAANSGGPVWARLISANNEWASDFDAGGPGSGKEVIVSDVTILAGGKTSLILAVFG